MCVCSTEEHHFDTDNAQFANAVVTRMQHKQPGTEDHSQLPPLDPGPRRTYTYGSSFEAQEINELRAEVAALQRQVRDDIAAYQKRAVGTLARRFARERAFAHAR